MKRVIQFGYQGSYKIDGKSYPGSLYFPRGGGLGMVWYYGTSGNMAGNALCTLQPDGSYSGELILYDRKGNIIQTGTVNVQ